MKPTMVVDCIYDKTHTCSFVAKGETDDEIFREMHCHALTDHADIVTNMKPHDHDSAKKKIIKFAQKSVQKN